MIYFAWAAFVAAVAVQFIHWPLASMAGRRERIGMDGGVIAGLFWPNAIAALALAAWPFIAAGTLDWDRDPSVFSVFLMTGGALVLGFILSLALQMLAGEFMARAPDYEAARALVIVETVTAFGALATVALAYAVMIAGQDPYR